MNGGVRSKTRRWAMTFLVSDTPNGRPRGDRNSPPTASGGSGESSRCSRRGASESSPGSGPATLRSFFGGQALPLVGCLLDTYSEKMFGEPAAGVRVRHLLDLSEAGASASPGEP